MSRASEPLMMFFSVRLAILASIIYSVAGQSQQTAYSAQPYPQPPNYYYPSPYRASPYSPSPYPSSPPSYSPPSSPPSYSPPSSPPSYSPPRSPPSYSPPRSPPSYSPPSSPPSYTPPSSPPSYTPPSSPPSYSPPRSPPSYSPPNSPPSYSPPRPPPSYSPPASYASPPSGTSSYASPPYSGYAPPSYQQQPYYPTNRQSYQEVNYEYGALEECDDHSCKPDECCEFNGKRKVCTLQDMNRDTTLMGTCTRFKRCNDNGDCPPNHCCVIRADGVTFDDYGKIAQNNYGYQHYGYETYGYKAQELLYGQKEFLKQRGECVLAGAATDTCRRPVDGVTNGCPCMMGLTCQFAAATATFGMCVT